MFVEVEAVSLILKQEQAKVHGIKTVNIIIYNFGILCYTCFCIKSFFQFRSIPFFYIFMDTKTILQSKWTITGKANHKIHSLIFLYSWNDIQHIIGVLQKKKKTVQIFFELFSSSFKFIQLKCTKTVLFRHTDILILF